MPLLAAMVFPLALLLAVPLPVAGAEPWPFVPLGEPFPFGEGISGAFTAWIAVMVRPKSKATATLPWTLRPIWGTSKTDSGLPIP